jgi:hypothetical protein
MGSRIRLEKVACKSTLGQGSGKYPRTGIGRGKYPRTGIADRDRRQGSGWGSGQGSEEEASLRAAAGYHLVAVRENLPRKGHAWVLGYGWKKLRAKVPSDRDRARTGIGDRGKYPRTGIGRQGSGKVPSDRDRPGGIAFRTGIAQTGIGQGSGIGESTLGQGSPPRAPTSACPPGGLHSDGDWLGRALLAMGV